MKKFILIPVAIVMICGLILGCAAPAPSPAPGPGPAPAPAPAPDKEFKWKMQGFLPPPEPQHSESWAKLVDMIAENTNGQVQIELFSMGAIVKTHEMLGATRDGVLDALVSSVGYYRGAVPVLDVIDGLPFSWESPQDLHEVYTKYGLSELPRQALADYGVHLLGHQAEAGEGLGLMAPKPIKTLADLKGLKMRSHGAFLDWWKALGAETVSMAFPEVYAAIATGTIDAVATAWGGQLDMKFYELVKFGVIPYQAGATGGGIYINQKSWDDLGPELQGIITKTYEDWRDWDITVHQPWRQEFYVGKLKELGVTWTTLPQSDQDIMLEEAMKIWDKAAAVDDLSAKAVGIVVDYYKEKGRIR